jgi:hypothetical protein
MSAMKKPKRRRDPMPLAELVIDMSYALQAPRLEDGG